jgi:uncharacterized protein YciI
MSLFVVIREAGQGWTDGGAFDQPQVNDHAAFMNTLVGDGFVHFAGPLAGSEQGRIRALVIVDAENEADIHARLAEDPWAVAQLLVTASIEPWSLFVGANRLRPAQLAAN